MAEGIDKWSKYFGGLLYYYVESSPAIGTTGNIYIGHGNGYLYSVDSSGTQKWGFNAGSTEGLKSAPVVGPDGSIYIKTRSG